MRRGGAVRCRMIPGHHGRTVAPVEFAHDLGSRSPWHPLIGRRFYRDLLFPKTPVPRVYYNLTGRH